MTLIQFSWKSRVKELIKLKRYQHLKPVYHKFLEKKNILYRDRTCTNKCGPALLDIWHKKGAVAPIDYSSTFATAL